MNSRKFQITLGLIVAVFLAGRVFAQPSQQPPPPTAPLTTVISSSTTDDFGSAVTSIGDIDADGAEDFLVGAPRSGPLTGPGALAGKVIAYSGRTGAQIYTIDGQPSDFLGASLSRIADLDGDTIEEVVVGALGCGGFVCPNAPSTLRFFSGQTGAELSYSPVTNNAYDNLGWSVDRIADLDNDGKEDVIAGVPSIPHFIFAPIPPPPLVEVYSGGSGALLHSVPGPVSSNFGKSVASIEDVNNDGYEDILAGGPYYRLDPLLAFPLPGFVKIISGFDGTVLHTIPDPTATPYSLFGESVARIGDQNNDNHDDFIVGTPFSRLVYIYSGLPPYPVIHTFSGLPAPIAADFGGEVSAADLSGDGVDDIIIGSPGFPTFSTPGVVHVYKGKTFEHYFTYQSATPAVGFGESISRIADTNGDAIEELVVGSSQASQAYIYALGHSQMYGVINPSTNQSLTLEALPITGMPPAVKVIRISGGPPGGTGELFISTHSANQPISSLGITAWVNISNLIFNPPIQITFDNAGVFTFTLNTSIGSSVANVFFQATSNNPLQTSNGLKITLVGHN